VNNDYGRLDIAVIPSLPEQEAEAEAQRLRGAPTLPEPQQSTSYAEPVDTTPTREIDVQGGDSHQVPWQGQSGEGASAVTHQHYWIHKVEETIDRGYYSFNSQAFPLTEGVPVQLLGLDDLRPRAYLLCIAVATDVVVCIGDRDMINGNAPESTGIQFTAAQDSFDYRARKELWAIAVGGSATVGVTSYKSEPTAGTLGTKVTR
jgi:hypothetical protein